MLVGGLGQDAHRPMGFPVDHGRVAGYEQDADALFGQATSDFGACRTVSQMDIHEGQIHACRRGVIDRHPAVGSETGDLMAHVFDQEAELHRDKGFIFDNQDTGHGGDRGFFCGQPDK